MVNWFKKQPICNQRIGLGALVLLAGIAGVAGWQFLRTPPGTPDLERTLTELTNQVPKARIDQLTRLVNSNDPRSRHRARYLLAADLNQNRQGIEALKWLDGLEKDYPLLSANILVQRGKAQSLAGQTDAARQTWQTLLKEFTNQPEAAEALYALGKTDPSYWDRAIKDFPAHPRTVEIAQERLQQNPNQPQLLLLLAKHGLYLPNIKTTLDQLSTTYANQLTPTDWQAVGFGYWEKLDYEKAARAYARAPKTALNRFRAARGLQLVGQAPAAIKGYQQMLAEFPTAPEAPLALLRLARLVKDPASKLSYLDQAIQAANRQKLPERAAEALSDKIQLLEKQNNPTAAAQARQELFRIYAETEAAGEQRWQLAQQAAKQKNWSAARAQALKIAEANPNSELAPRALFWSGRWAQQTGQAQQQTQAFRQLWQRYPHSYYTWRAASLSGWQVGTFTSVETLSPKIDAARAQALPLGVGSPVVQELYSIGQPRAAWEHWQWEFQNRVQPSPEEQLSDGLLRLGVGEYLDGIFMLENLRQRARHEPAARATLARVQQQPGYWYALYPLPYLESVQRWSGTRQLNPLLVLALIRQESRFQTKIRSVAGAVGLMQVMPETADWVAKQVPLKKYSLEAVEDNVNLGTWYLRHTHETYRGNTLLALASYNAGPGNLDNWLNRFSFDDPDRFMEQIPFDETQNYVKRVMENYWNYLRLYNPQTIQHLLEVKK